MKISNTMIGNAPNTTAIAIVMNNERERLFRVNKRTPSAMITPAVGAPAAMRNHPKKPMLPIMVTRNEAMPERKPATIKPKI